MRPNGSSKNDVPPSSEIQSRLVFDRMNRYIGRLSKDATSNNVHRFRTNSRRVEALASEFAPETRNQKKLLKLLSKLRKKAGKLRDLDVQIVFLKELKLHDHQEHRTQLLEWLESERSRRAKKLSKTFAADTAAELRKRLRRAKADLRLDAVQPLQLAFEHLPNPGQAPFNEKALHACRISAKRARYLAELADSTDAKAFVGELKSAQDVIGEWHDVLKLKNIAEQRFGGVHDSPLVAALQNISRARFRRAASSWLAALSAISELRQRTSEAPPTRKTAASEIAVQRTAVA